MKAFIIAAVSADGFIAKNDNHPAMWTSKEDKRRFVELTKRAGVIVMGSKTFRTLPKPLKERVNIVYSRSMTSVTEGAELTHDEPAMLLEKLEARGFKEVAICGGSEIYTAFMKAGVVDRIFLTIEPVIFGKGISLFKEDFDQTRLALVSCEPSQSGSILLEYKVKE